MDTLTGIFVITFGIGFLFTFVSFLLGAGHFTGLAHGHDLPGLHGHAHAAPAGGPGVAHVDAGTAHGHVPGHGESGHGVAPLNGFTLAAFLMLFGATGFLAHRVGGWAAPVGLGLATTVGLAAAAAIFLFLSRVLVPNQTVMRPADYQREGTIARVTVTIPTGGVGEIVYTLAGVRHSDAARGVELEGAPIGRGEEVVITGFEKGVAQVVSVKAMLDEPR
jgi:hypothetical protein